jgi:ribosomal protein S18 acetylase RimI-like enzyme
MSTDASIEIRPMQGADLPSAIAASAAAFELDLAEPRNAERWGARVAHPLRTDPDGSFVAELDGRIAGVAQAIRRERLWNLSLLTIDPRAQSKNAGRLLFDRSLEYEDAGTNRGLIVSSSDSRALRLYALAGFSLLPALDANGIVDRRALPRPNGAIREAGASDLEALAAISRVVRGGPHTQELELVLDGGGTVLRHGDRGFSVVERNGRVSLLAALDAGAARELMWAGLARPGDTEVTVRWITGGQDWAIDVVLAAGLRISPGGALAVRGLAAPLLPFIPSGAFG